MLKPLLITPFLMLATMLLAPILIRVGLISPLGGFGAAIGAWLVGAGSGLIAGAIGAWKPDTRPLAWAAFGVGVVLAVALVAVLSRAPRAPIHDVTTDFDDPPQFSVATDHPDNADRDLAYPHGHPDSTEIQRAAFPDIETLVMCDIDHEIAWSAAIASAEEMGWAVTWANTSQGYLEAEATSRLFQFVDDVVVRIPPSANRGCLHVDVRSVSRVGQSDLGANAARILAFLEVFGANATAAWRESAETAR
ncbi:MAG: DUF1499 domain-containing protein [Acidobacteria bacterium]|nr:DUF1499 domain-containing protein [Acidobacteriota bacterium]